MAMKKSKATVKVNVDDFVRYLKKGFKAARDKAVTAPDTSLTDFEDGRYVARLVSASIGKSQASGRYQIDMAWKLVEPPYAGKIKHAYEGVDSDQNKEYFFAKLKKLGIDIAQLDETDIPDLLEQLTAAKPHLLCQIALKTRNDFQNVYINQLLEDEEDGEEAEEHQDEEDADAEPVVKRRKKTTPEPEPEEDEEDADAEEDDDDEEEDEPEPVAKKKAKVVPVAKKKAKPEPDEDEDEDEEDEDEEDEDEEDEEQLHISIGSEVLVQTKEGTVQGTIVEIFPDEQKIRVKTAAGKTLRLPADRVMSVVEKTVVAAKKKAKKR